MEKSTKSVRQNQDLLTELTETEMASTTGGLLTRQQLSGWLRQYKAGTLNQTSVLLTLNNEPASDRQANILVAYKWFGSLTPNNKNIVRGIYRQVKAYLQS